MGTLKRAADDLELLRPQKVMKLSALQTVTEDKKKIPIHENSKFVEELLEAIPGTSILELEGNDKDEANKENFNPHNNCTTGNSTYHHSQTSSSTPLQERSLDVMNMADNDLHCNTAGTLSIVNRPISCQQNVESHEREQVTLQSVKENGQTKCFDQGSFDPGTRPILQRINTTAKVFRSFGTTLCNSVPVSSRVSSQ